MTLALILATNLFFVLVPRQARAATGSSDVTQDVANQLQAAGGETGAGFSAPTDPRLIAASIIRTALTFLGMIFLVLTIYAGFMWMTAGGEEEKVKKATDTLKAAVIGLAIVLSAYSITYFAVRLVTGKYSDQPMVEFQFKT